MIIEIITTRSESPYRARIKGDNGEIVWWTESYTTKFDAVHAVTLLAEAFGYPGVNFAPGRLTFGVGSAAGHIEVKEVDKRG